MRALHGFLWLFLSTNWLDATIGFGWVKPIIASLTAFPASNTIAAGCGAAFIFFVIAWLNERRAYKTEAGRASIKAARQGIDGELPRLPLFALIVLFALIGFIEELLFRYAIFTLANALFSSFLPAPLTLAIALLVSSLAFCLAHTRYQNLSTIAVIFAMGLLFWRSFCHHQQLGNCCAGPRLIRFSCSYMQAYPDKT